MKQATLVLVLLVSVFSLAPRGQGRFSVVDAIITPGGSGAGLAARAGYPIVAVPFGMVPNAPNQPFPAGFNARPVPYGVGFVGAQCSEPKLIELAYAFEQATKRRVPPPATP